MFTLGLVGLTACVGYMLGSMAGEAFMARVWPA